MSKTMIISSESSNLYTTKRFIAEAKKLRLNPVHLNPFEINLQLNNQADLQYRASHYLFRTTGIRFDDIDLLIAKLYETNGCKIINPLQSIADNRNKDMSLFHLAYANLPVINSLVFRGKINETLIKQINELVKNQKFILKMNRGNQGIGVQLINGIDSLLSILETYHALGDQKFLLQPYTPHQREFRVLLTDKKILAVVEKIKSAEDFRGNAKRAKTKLLKRPELKLMELANLALKTLNYQYAGVDIIETKEGFKILEVNCIPGFESIEQLSSKNIARELLLDFL